MNRIQIARQLWNKLWEDYIKRVSYAQVYQQMITEAGGKVANDHIAFRSLRLSVDTPEGKKKLGIDYVARIPEALGYSVAGEYTFPEQKLYARHYRHPDADDFDLPKLFISELIVDELPDARAQLIYETVTSGLTLPAVSWLNAQTLDTDSAEHIATQLQGIFTRPWELPKRSVVEEVNAVSQYGAWVLLHGYAVNHFTGYINRQNTPLYPDIESTAKKLAQRGVPMKAQIEGSREMGLRQTATQAVTEMVTVLDDSSGERVSIPWTYAYYELAERSMVELETGQKVLFDGFQGANAQQLFEMTRKGDSEGSSENSATLGG